MAKAARGGKKVVSRAFLEKLTGPLTMGRLIHAVRMSEDWSLDEMSKLLGITRGNLCDIEHDRRVVKATRAARWAAILGYEADDFVAVALQHEVDALGLGLRVTVQAA